MRLIVLIALAFAPLAWADGPRVLEPEVNKAINAGVRALLRAQKADGSWDGPNLIPPHLAVKVPKASGGREGVTAICLLALLASDVKSSHPSIKKGFGLLYKMRGDREKRAAPGQVVGLTYDEAVVCMALHKWSEAIGKKKRRGKKLAEGMRKCYLPKFAKAWLRAVASDISVSHTGGGWGYQIRRATNRYSTFTTIQKMKRNSDGTSSPMVQGPGSGKKPKGTPTNLGAVGKIDFSNTQYAVLGMRAAELCTIGIAGDTWQKVLTYFIQQQEGGPADPNRRGPGPEMSSGTRKKYAQPRGWGYHARETGTVTMTCCGVAMVAIAREQLAFHRRLKGNDATLAQMSIDDGLKWIGDHWALEGSEGPGKDPRNKQPKGGPTAIDGYLLYGLERAGVLGRVDIIGAHDWYHTGARRILDRQRKDGSWVGMHGMAVETAFALLFLKRATKPIVVKIELTGGSNDK